MKNIPWYDVFEAIIDKVPQANSAALANNISYVIANSDYAARPMVPSAFAKDGKFKFQIHDGRGLDGDKVALVIEANDNSDFYTIVQQVKAAMADAHEYNILYYREFASPALSPDEVDPRKIDIGNWSLQASPCVFYENRQMYNLLRPYNKQFKKSRRKGERHVHDDGKIRVYFTGVDTDAWAKYVSEGNGRFKHVHELQRDAEIDEEATDRSICEFILKGKLPQQLYPRLKAKIFGDAELRQRWWHKPINATGVGEYESLRVTPFIQAASISGLQGPDDWQVRAVRIRSLQHKMAFSFRKASKGIHLQDPKNMPAFLLQARDKRMFFVMSDDDFVYRLDRVICDAKSSSYKGKKSYKPADATNPGNWDMVPLVDSFLSDKISKAIDKWYRSPGVAPTGI
jgi:hypothetical protein